MKDYLKEYLESLSPVNKFLNTGSSEVSKGSKGSVVVTDIGNNEGSKGAKDAFGTFDPSQRVVYEKYEADCDLAEADLRIQADLRHRGILVSENVGPCPHCQKPLLIYSHPDDDSVWVECPSGREGLFKVLRRAEDETTPALCSDCGLMPALITGRCPECIQRLMLCPNDPCEKCGGLRYWRHRANKTQPAGFAWHCSQCQPLTGKNVAWQELAE